MSEMQAGQCKHCRWWDGGAFAPGGSLSDTWGVCVLTDDTAVEYTERMNYVSHNGSIGRLVTAPDFGCVQFEAKVQDDE